MHVLAGTEPVGSDQAKRPRADARRNRERVLAAADTVFAAKGVTASTEEIAREAGVGIGTVFRHFPTKEALLTAVFVDRQRRLAEMARALATEDDPGAAFFAFLDHVVDQSATKNAFAAALTEAGVDVREAMAEVGQQLTAAVEKLLVRGQEAGAVRGDVGVREVLALLVGMARAAEHADWDREIQARAVAVVCDGLRPDPRAGSEREHMARPL